ncbi:MAG: glycerophosphodiester phosphodiesterase, partial [Thermoanaerobaculia bacterium]
PPPWIVGHRGAGGEAPENTLESFQLAVEQGADMVELDLQLTADDTLVAFHDRDLRLLSQEAVPIESLSLDQLADAVYLDRRGNKRQGMSIPTLATILQALPADLPLNLELKRYGADRERLVSALGREIAGREQLLVSSFDWDLLALVRHQLPSRPVAPIASRDGEALLQAAQELEAFSVHSDWRIARHNLVHQARAAGRPTLVYTVNQQDLARRLLARGVSGLFSDHPGRLRRQLEAPGS